MVTVQLDNHWPTLANHYRNNHRKGAKKSRVSRLPEDAEPDEVYKTGLGMGPQHNQGGDAGSRHLDA